MKLLKEVKILGKTFAVEYFDFDERLTRNDMNGNISYDNQKIQVNSTIHLERQGETFLHEIIHAISDALMLELDEKTVCGLHTGLYQVFKDNGLFAEEVVVSDRKRCAFNILAPCDMKEPNCTLCKAMNCATCKNGAEEGEEFCKTKGEHPCDKWELKTGICRTCDNGKWDEYNPGRGYSCSDTESCIDKCNYKVKEIYSR